MKSSKRLENALESTICIEEKLKAAVAGWGADIDRFASSYELQGVDHELRSTIRQREHQLHSSIRSQSTELTCLIRDVRFELDMIKFDKQLWNSTLFAIVASPFTAISVLALIDTFK
ncbi:hypothetical protein NUH87_28850 [Pseudomonas batumici]|uniref:hypothetical protein n=1 Tax=Pseudomonas batumici TaxID=226910 RepID=UPI0030CB94B3